MDRSKDRRGWHAAGLTIGALGIVFGDIGTSPLYALRECFVQSYGLSVTSQNIIGVLSLIFWSLIVVISLKYLVLVLSADNHGEGGVLALMALAVPRRVKGLSAKRRLVILAGLFGTALLYGDGIITPAISVLSAVEGLAIATPLFKDWVVAITIAILFTLFFFQRHGTARIGLVFGPIILIWFIIIGGLGLMEIFNRPEVLAAVNPLAAGRLIAQEGWLVIPILGAVFLVVTGGEALYADMGHFGPLPIRRAWFSVALPGLVLNYFGQGALLISNPRAIENPFYLLAPSWALIPLVILATLVTIIASQAIISGTFSLTSQAVQLGYLPRFYTVHTSRKEIGQIYVGAVNWMLLVLTVWLVLEFGSSSALAAAYGIAVSATMVITSFLVYFVTRRLWKWSVYAAVPIIGVFLIIDLLFFTANILKIFEGGWVPLVIATIMMVVFTTWRRGREILNRRFNEILVPLESFVKSIMISPPMRIPGTAVFMCRNNELVNPALMHNVRHNKVLHERVILLSVLFEEEPYVTEAGRIDVRKLAGGFEIMTVRFGFMEQPDLFAALLDANYEGRLEDLSQVTFFVGRETLLATKARAEMALWREHLFAFLTRNAQPITNYFRIPREHVVEIGLQLQI
ncbi:MAG: potassium transporter Kup [Deltaproteobacteria bacterium]|nr:potassium transporter Kup [Deltaproteobacteria bacterium]